MADLLRIGDYLRRKPAQLSGGQAQRVAVARALVWEPAICLMDEPLSNLDALLRLHMRTELNRLHRKLDKTFVFVTHDQEEAMTLATRVAVLKDGRLVQFDEPRTIYRRPANRFVAEFMGRPAMNTIDGLVEGGVFRAGAVACDVDRPDGPVTLGIRPEQIAFADAGSPGDDADRRRQGGDRTRHALDLSEWQRDSDHAADAGQLRRNRARPTGRPRLSKAGTALFRRRDRAEGGMTAASFVPLIIAAIVWLAFWRVNRTRGWFTVGEIIFWDVIVLILIQLVWLRWF